MRKPLTRKSRSLRRGGTSQKWAKRLLYVCMIGGTILILVFVSLRFIDPPSSTLMLIRRAEFSLGIRPRITNTAWRWVRLSNIAPQLQKAVIVAEDSHFLRHHGIDFGSLFSVLSGERRQSRVPRGASTITMQTVKNLFLWPGRSYLRKFLELSVSPIFDFIVGKRRTLELYLNLVEWGPGVYGIEAAAQKYFGKSAGHLTLSESAALAAVLPSPLTQTPRALSSAAKRRLTRIVREGGGAVLPW